MRARMALMISNQKVEFREVLLRDKPQAMIDISSKGTVPILLLQSGKVIEDRKSVV